MALLTQLDPRLILFLLLLRIPARQQRDAPISTLHNNATDALETFLSHSYKTYTS